MTAQTDTSRRDELIARNLAAVETHFHNETPETIDPAIAVYTDDIVWEVPARGLVLRSIEDVKQEYLKIFGSMNIHKIVNLHRFATEEWVFDDSIFEWTITGDGFRNCPYPPGTTVSVRLLHAFQCRDGKICREHGYEIWRDINDHARVQDDIPATATVQVFGERGGPVVAGGCLLCELERAAPGAVVFRDELWAAEVAPGYEVPGWFFLRVRRHAELLTGLDDAELAAFGRRARDLVAAVTEATGAPATYLLHFGENYRHFHALVAARGADIPAAQRGGNILGLRPGHVDVAAAVALVPTCGPPTSGPPRRPGPGPGLAPSAQASSPHPNGPPDLPPRYLVLEHRCGTDGGNRGESGQPVSRDRPSGGRPGALRRRPARRP